MVPSLLIDVHDSILAAIDVQTYFLAKLPVAEREAICQRICWLINLAQRMHVPILATAEDLMRDPLDPQVASALSPHTIIHNKLVFGLAGQPDILAAVAQSRRRTAILIGLETDVCVAQSALGLIELGYRVAVIADATASPGTAHAYGLERIRDAGGLILSVKGLYYEWMRTVSHMRQFEAANPDLGAPQGIIM